MDDSERDRMFDGLSRATAGPWVDPAAAPDRAVHIRSSVVDAFSEKMFRDCLAEHGLSCDEVMAEADADDDGFEDWRFL